MIISDKFVIGHIPKTGGHVLALMLSRIPDLKFEAPFTIQEGHVYSTKEQKHNSLYSLSEITTTEKDILMVMRDLPSWFLSYIVGQSVHYKLNYKQRLMKVNIKKTYQQPDNVSVQKLLPPTLMAYTTFPDYILKEMGIVHFPIKWLRMENLADDLIDYLELEDEDICKQIREIRTDKYSYKVNTPDKYWNNSSVKTLYSYNPLWSSIEKNVYGKLMLDSFEN